MKKIISILLTTVVLFALCSCASTPQENEYEKVKSIIVDYALATLTAWNYGFDDDFICKDETIIKDWDNPKNVDFEQLVSVTNIPKEKIEEIFIRDTGVISNKTVTNYSNKFYEPDGEKKLGLYNSVATLSGYTLELSKSQYCDIIRNVRMVEYLFNQIYGSYLNSAMYSNSGYEYTKLKELKEYVDNISIIFQKPDEYKYTFKSNYDLVTETIREKIEDLD